MPTDARDELWNSTYGTRYMCLYYLSLAHGLVSRWTVFDDVVKTLVALTASGSAVAGWALWKEDGFKSAWIVFAGAAAVLAIVHAALGVQARIKVWADLKRDLTVLSNDLETFQMRMRITSEFDIPDFSKEWLELRKRYSEATSRLVTDLLATPGFRERSQDEANRAMGVQAASA